MQRVLDVFFSASALIVLLPFFLPMTLVLRLTGEGEIFFRQKRVGRGGEKFDLLKFSTMLADSPNMGTGTVTLKDDPRVLPVGRFLRKTKLNELPQLVNVLLGEMSFVGPRPQTQRCFDAFPPSSQAEIVKAVPGLSGVGSIVFRGEEDMMHASENADRFYDEVIMPYKGELECWYVKNQCLTVYLKTIFVTVWVVLFPASSVHWKAFRRLPCPPRELVDLLNYRRS